MVGIDWLRLDEDGRSKVRTRGKDTEVSWRSNDPDVSQLSTIPTNTRYKTKQNKNISGLLLLFFFKALL